MQSYEVTIDEQGRLDKLLAFALSQSRNQIEKLIRGGLVEVGGSVVTKPSHKLSAGDSVRYTVVEAPKRKAIPIDFDIEILYEDSDLLVVNKPAGLVVHPAPSVKHATLVDWLVARGISLSTMAGEERHGIVHRIDKDTTGALVVAKNNAAHQELSRQLQDKTMGRYYLALIDHPLKEHRHVDKPIARNPNNRLKMAVVEGGRDAKTDFLQIAEGRLGSALIAAKLHTGRTHQIRVHLESMGRHVLGDGLYGFKSKEGKIMRSYLHAYMLYLTHPTTREKIEIIAPIFTDMQDYIDRYFTKGDVDEKIDSGRLHAAFATASFVA